jgi:hypothetical protein
MLKDLLVQEEGRSIVLKQLIAVVVWAD